MLYFLHILFFFSVLDKENTERQTVYQDILKLLMLMNCKKIDKIIARVVLKSSCLSYAVLKTVFRYCLKKMSSDRVGIAVIILCKCPKLLGQLEEWVLSRVDVVVDPTSPKKCAFLNSDSEWKKFQPLLMMYLGAVCKGKLFL